MGAIADHGKLGIVGEHILVGRKHLILNEHRNGMLGPLLQKGGIASAWITGRRGVPIIFGDQDRQIRAHRLPCGLDMRGPVVNVGKTVLI
jgi:hypothetical protein